MDPTSSVELDLNLEAKNRPKTLSGKELPDNWPQILPVAEEGQSYTTLRDPGENPEVEPPPIRQLERLSFKLENEGKELVFLAANHSKDPEDPQFSKIAVEFSSIKPDIVLTESEWTIPSEVVKKRTRDQTIQEWGEVGFMNWLANQNDQIVNIDGIDIPFQDWVEGFKQRGYSAEEIFVININRNIYYHLGISRDQGLDLRQTESEFIANFRKNYEEPNPNDYFKQVLSALPRSDDQKWTWENFVDEYQKTTGKEFVFSKVNSMSDLPKVFADEREFRDVYIVSKIIETLNKKDKVMVVMGSGHAIRQKGALEQYFDTKAQRLTFEDK